MSTVAAEAKRMRGAARSRGSKRTWEERRRRFDWLELAIREINEKKVAIVEAMLWIDEDVSAVQLSRALGLSIGVVSYHLSQLEEAGSVVRTRQRQVRGAVETFYRSALRHRR